MTEEMIAKAREAQSAEELLQLAKDNGMDEFTMEDAEDLYAQMHASGEMSDEEMENVSGGCSTTVDGQKYTVVSCGLKCFTGKWEDGKAPAENYNRTIIRSDKTSLRSNWYMWSSTDNTCGTCIHLGFTKALTGYCEVQYN